MNKLLVCLFIGLGSWTLSAQPIVGSLPPERIPPIYDGREEGVFIPDLQIQKGVPVWAIALTDAMRINTAKETGTDPGALSVQSLIQCSAVKEGYFQDSTGREVIVSYILGKHPNVLAKDFPFDPQATECPIIEKDQVINYPIGVTELPMGHNSEIKKAILEKGCVIAGLHWEDNFYDTPTNTYCYNSFVIPALNDCNKPVLIVGWNDVESKWLVRDCSQNLPFEQGYFWVHYKDALINIYTYFVPMASTLPYTQLYTHTLKGRNHGQTSSGDSIRGVCKFHAESPEMLTALGTQSIRTYSTIRFRVYQDKKLIYTSAKTKILPFGLLRIPLSEPLSIQGDFYVECIYYNEEKYLFIPCNDPGKRVPIPKGCQWVWIDEEWEEAQTLSFFPYNLCIYAYANPVSPSAAEEVDAIASIPLLQNGQINPDLWEQAQYVQVFDLAGKQVALFTPEGSKSLDLIPGIYLFQVILEDNRTYVQKLKLP